MIHATTWHGRKGTVILGPTEHLVARWLAGRTTHGRVTLRTSDLATALRLSRSEAYRITARLRALGLFGIENDQGGTKGGRRIWRTAIAHDGAELDPVKHREAWARVVAWAKGRALRLAARLGELRANHTRQLSPGWQLPTREGVAESPISPPSRGSLLERLIQAGLKPELATEWAVPEDEDATPSEREDRRRGH